jgi:phage anti-repressor protein
MTSKSDGKKVSEEYMLRMIADCKHQWLAWFDDIVRNDGFAISFQSMGQYRNGLRKAIKNGMEAP